MNENKTRVVVLILDKVDFNTTTNKRHYIMIMCPIQQEDIITINAPNRGAPKYIKQMVTAIQ